MKTLFYISDFYGLQLLIEPLVAGRVKLPADSRFPPGGPDFFRQIPDSKDEAIAAFQPFLDQASVGSFSGGEAKRINIRSASAP